MEIISINHLQAKNNKGINVIKPSLIEVTSINYSLAKVR